MTSNTLRICGLALAIVALLAAPAMAHNHSGHELPGDEVDDDTAFDHMVRGIDVLPDREAMEERFPDAAQRLIDAAEDTEATDFKRWRATSLLGNFKDDDVQKSLLGLTEDEEPRIRAMAFYVLGTSFLEDGDDGLFSYMEAGLHDETHRVRANIVRSFGWTDHSGAHEMLEEIADGGHKDEELHNVAALSLERLANKR